MHVLFLQGIIWSVKYAERVRNMLCWLRKGGEGSMKDEVISVEEKWK